MIPRSNVDLAKQIFSQRLGQGYGYGGEWSPADLTAETDCSGLAGEELEALTKGPGMVWGHPVSTESWDPGAQPGDVGPYGTVCVSSPAGFPADAVATIAIHHGGGGPDSHMNITVDGVLMEDSGNHGVCTRGTGAMEQTDPYWNQWWFLPGPIMTTMQGLDYAGGRPSGADIKAAGYGFVCRYLSDGGSSLPDKQLVPGEAQDLTAAGVVIVSNWETRADAMLGGYAQGAADAHAAWAQHKACGGPDNRPIYFSADFDATPEQQTQIDAYLQGAASVIGAANVGIYGGFWPVSRALNNGTARWAWQAQAWSGGNQDPRINILQNNDAGYVNVGGVQCDLDQSLTEDFGQWNHQPGNDVTQDQFNQLLGILQDIQVQLRGPNLQGWPQLGQNPAGQNQTMVDGLSAMLASAQTALATIEQAYGLLVQAHQEGKI